MRLCEPRPSPSFAVRNDEGSDDEHPVLEDPRQAYRVLATCHICGGGVRIVFWCLRLDIRVIQTLLTTSLSLICPSCAAAQGYHGP
ncbi:E7 [Equus caballus papillomavirus 4]|uniref:E7 n=1 Tax=Equus caballus papillomavirus 4 TaxID=1235428 RepID=K9M8U6_9PAPI|nr:E7 [Equus caballus papillomavirus 4]AFS89108.1 E7 [Equus caballus papillomavirus 4]